jgi:chromosome segregation ATPase
MGKEEPFERKSGDTPGGVLAEYRKLLKEIAESQELIALLEKEFVRLKEVEETISVRDEEKSRLDEELLEVYARIGKALLEDPDYSDAAEIVRRQEGNFLAKIDEHEKKLEELEKREGGLFAWLGKNAQMTLSKAILSKERSSLKRLYRETGEKYLATKPVESLVGSNAAAAEKTLDLTEKLSNLTTELSELRGERRKIREQFGADSTPDRSIHGIEKTIAQAKENFPALYLSMGSFAITGRELFSPFLRQEDEPILLKIGSLETQINKGELDIEKIKTAIRIDDEKAEIEKMKKAIIGQERKIAAAREAIMDIENQIAEAEQQIKELQEFLNNNALA